MEKIDAAVKRMASKPAAVAAFTLLTALLPWIITFTPPLLRSLEVGFATEAWKLVVAWLTTPVLFVLVNFVILSIWATSGSSGAAAAENGGSGDLLAIAAAVPPPPTKRKLETTLVFLPPVAVVSKPDPQISVFSRVIPPPPPSVREIFDPEPERTKKKEEKKEEEGEKVAEEEKKVVAESGGGGETPAPAAAPAAPIGILPPPLPGFLVGQGKLKKSASAGGGPTRKKKVARTRSDKSGVVIKREPGGEDPDDLTQRVESMIANFRARLRQE